MYFVASYSSTCKSCGCACSRSIACAGSATIPPAACVAHPGAKRTYDTNCGCETGTPARECVGFMRVVGHVYAVTCLVGTKPSVVLAVWRVASDW
eukprot:5126872-Prymnesium_polylepis.1